MNFYDAIFLSRLKLLVRLISRIPRCFTILRMNLIFYYSKKSFLLLDCYLRLLIVTFLDKGIYIKNM